MFKRQQEPNSVKLQRPQQFCHPASSYTKIEISHIFFILYASQKTNERVAKFFCQGKMYMLSEYEFFSFALKIVCKKRYTNIICFTFSWPWGLAVRFFVSLSPH